MITRWAETKQAICNYRFLVPYPWSSADLIAGRLLEDGVVGRVLSGVGIPYPQFDGSGFPISWVDAAVVVSSYDYQALYRVGTFARRSNTIIISRCAWRFPWLQVRPWRCCGLYSLSAYFEAGRLVCNDL